MTELASGGTIGDAITAAKTSMATEHPSPDIMMGWTLLGDPTIPLNS